jgi:hypothetical protein
MTGVKTYKEIDTEKTRGKKRFIERQVEEKEAEEAIEEFLDNPETFPDKEEKSDFR